MTRVGADEVVGDLLPPLLELLDEQAATTLHTMATAARAATLRLLRSLVILPPAF
ncbi:MAG TPA: hypothetical protein VMR14_04675 [Streptosporangiaceae bacterium]|jgi:hypothetical protein|nr:hypothetical protein [Streptosporangiaceae bacterium]